MSRRTIPLYGILAFALVAASCGGGDNGGFEDCGNGVLDGGEICDDGNLLDEDSCLSTCEPNVCGDGFRNPGIESCDLVPPTGVSCGTLGFFAGTVQCASDCTLDTSGCTGTALPTATPAPEVTPSGNVETATPTSGGSPGTPTPTVTSTPGGGTCESGDTVVVTATLDKAFAAFAMTLAYPTDSVNIPGSGPLTGMGNRVVFNVSGGLNTASDDDDIGGDQVDDTLHASFVSSVDNDPGDVFTVTFDCLAGQAKPAAGAFTCTVVSASTSAPDTIPDEVCTLVVQ